MALDSLTQSIYGAPVRRPFQPIQGNDTPGGNENPSGGGGSRPISPPDVMAAMQAMMQQGQQGAGLRAQGQHEFLFPEASRHLGIGGQEITAADPMGDAGAAKLFSEAPSFQGAGNATSASLASQGPNALNQWAMKGAIPGIQANGPGGLAEMNGVREQAQQNRISAGGGQQPPPNPWASAFTGNQSNLPLIGTQPTYGAGSGMNGQPISLPDNLAKPPPGYKGPSTQTYGPSPAPGAPGFVPPRF